MNEEALLTTVAEVGIAIAGFSGIAVVLGHRTDGEWSPQDTFRMRLLLRTSFAAVLFGLLPLALSSTDLPEVSVWTVASGFYLAFIVGGLTTVILWDRGTFTASTEPIGRIYSSVFPALLATELALLVANLVVLRTAWPYLFALLVTLTVSFIQFVRLLRRLWQSP